MEQKPNCVDPKALCPGSCLCTHSQAEMQKSLTLQTVSANYFQLRATSVPFVQIFATLLTGPHRAFCIAFTNVLS